MPDTENDLSQGNKGKVVAVHKRKPYDNKKRPNVVALGECSNCKSKNLLLVRIHYFKEDLVVFHSVSVILCFTVYLGR